MKMKVVVLLLALALALLQPIGGCVHMSRQALGYLGCNIVLRGIIQGLRDYRQDPLGPPFLTWRDQLLYRPVFLKYVKNGKNTLNLEDIERLVTDYIEGRQPFTDRMQNACCADTGGSEIISRQFRSGDLEVLLRKYDTINHDGVLSLDEFIHLMKNGVVKCIKKIRDELK